MENYTLIAQQVTAEWLTSVLSRSDYWTDGSVISFEIVRSYETPPSHITHLEVQTSLSQKKVILKNAKPDYMNLMGKEVNFYKYVKSISNILPIPKCFGYAF